MSFLEQVDPIYLFVAGCAIGAWALMRRRFGARRRGGQHVDSREHSERATGMSADSHHEVAAQFERQQVELCDLARDINGQIDSKMILLEQLIAQSQRQIDRLEELLADASQRELEPIPKR